MKLQQKKTRKNVITAKSKCVQVHETINFLSLLLLIFVLLLLNQSGEERRRYVQYKKLASHGVNNEQKSSSAFFCNQVQAINNLMSLDVV